MFRSQRRKWYKGITSYPNVRSRRARPSVFSRMWHRLATSVTTLPSLGKRLQAKLIIGAPNDKYEQEADQVADQAMRMPEPGIDVMAVKENQTTPALQRFCPECEDNLRRQPLEEEEEETLQRQPIDEQEETVQTSKDSTNGTTTTAKAAIDKLQGGGTSLSNQARAYFEPRFGKDFGDVRIHTGSEAEKAARSARAKAFTLGRNIVFGQAQYAPETRAGKRLMAHELTHVVQ